MVTANKSENWNLFFAVSSSLCGFLSIGSQRMTITNIYLFGFRTTSPEPHVNSIWNQRRSWGWMSKRTQHHNTGTKSQKSGLKGKNERWNQTWTPANTLLIDFFLLTFFSRKVTVFRSYCKESWVLSFNEERNMSSTGSKLNERSIQDQLIA